MKTKNYRIFNDMDEVSNQLRQYLNNSTGHDYNCQSLEQIVADERRISELTLAFAQTLAMIALWVASAYLARQGKLDRMIGRADDHGAATLGGCL